MTDVVIEQRGAMTRVTLDRAIRTEAGALEAWFVDAVKEALEIIEMESLYAESKTTADGVAKMLQERGREPGAPSGELDWDTIRSLFNKRKERR